MESTKSLKVIRLRESSLRNSRTRKPQRIGITARPTKTSPSTANTGRSITDSLLKVSATRITKPRRKEPIMKRLDNKVAIVTGASKGIGAGIAKAFGAEGAAVIVNYALDQAGAERGVREITGNGGRAIAVQGDVAQRSDAQRLVAEAKKAFGRLDVLVNNAGVFSFAPFEHFSEHEFHRQFNTNVLGMFLMIEAALPAFGAEGGSIINIGSTTSVTANPTLSIYVASKSAVNGLTRVLSKEFGPRKIRVNALNPGGTETEGT